jgi:hypothetical protein
VNQHFSIILDDFMRFTAPAKFGRAELSIIVEYHDDKERIAWVHSFGGGCRDAKVVQKKMSADW